MSDDISLNLGRACFNGVAARSQERVSPLAIVDGVAVAFRKLRVRAQQLGSHLLEALIQFTPKDLLNGSFGAGQSALADTSNGAHLVQAHDFDFDIALSELLPHY